MFLTICLVLLFSTSTLVAQTVTPPSAGNTTAAPAALARPNLNGLEKGEYARRQVELKLAQTRLARDTKAVANATQLAVQASDAKTKAAAPQRLAQAQQHATASQAAVTRAQSRLDDWQTSVLASHQAPANATVDWTKGTITATP